MSRCAPGPGPMVRRAALQAPLLRADLQRCLGVPGLRLQPTPTLGVLQAPWGRPEIPIRFQKKRGSEMARRYSPGASKDVEREMRKFKRGTLKSGKGGKGGKVKSRRQAIAIGLSEARREGKRVPSRPVGRPSKTARSQAANKAAPPRKPRRA